MIEQHEIQEFLGGIAPLLGAQLDVLRLPRKVLRTFEPSQVGTLVGTLVDACIPELDHLLPDVDGLPEVGLSKAPGILGDREGYPDFIHDSGVRAELKLLYKDPEGIRMKRPPTRREPSARVTQKVTKKNVMPDRDLLLVAAYQLQPLPEDAGLFSPTIVALGAFPMAEVVRARDHRLIECGGRWFGEYETPAIPSRIGRTKLASGHPLRTDTYGRKESEGHDFNEDTNFGKLKRIPYRPLQEFLRDHGATYARRGTYPEEWRISPAQDEGGPADVTDTEQCDQEDLSDVS